MSAIHGAPLCGIWPAHNGWEVWQGKPILARQVAEDGTFGTYGVKAGEWIVAMGPFLYRLHDGEQAQERETLYLILSDLEFRRHFAPRHDMEVVPDGA